mmetsp:Transcript_60474/g.148380  ORF Transcript_60474/g.148380 Transcript_60474/m.148380 type:complete len:290 (-) Transcript_60474:277-1146(-)
MNNNLNDFTANPWSFKAFLTVGFPSSTICSWSSKHISVKNFFILPLIIFSTTSGGFFESAICPSRTAFSFRNTSSGTSDEFKYNGFEATTCIANFFPASDAAAVSVIGLPSLAVISTMAADDPALVFPSALPWTYETNRPSVVDNLCAAETPRFSRIATIASSNANWTDFELYSSPRTTSLSTGPCWIVSAAIVASAICVARPTNASLFPAKSVSDETLTIDADFPSGDTLHATSPSSASRPLNFLDAFATPCFLNQSNASWMSPSVSPSAFLQSTIGAPDNVLSSFTS